MNKINNVQVLTTGLGDCSVMKLIQTELKPPQDSEIRVKILLTGIAWADVQMRQGTYPDAPKMPFVQGYDLIGEVVDVGKDVNKDLVGKTIGAIIQWGAYSKYINIPVGRAIEIPEGTDLIKAEALFLNYITAYQMLYRVANLKPGTTILVHGAAGGVGTALLQLCKLGNIKAYGTASKNKHNTVKQYGGIPIDYKNEDFEAFIKHREPGGIDAFFDFNGGRTFNKSFRLLNGSGKAIVYNLVEAGSSTFKAASFFIKFFVWNTFTRKTVKFYSIMTRYKKKNQEYPEDLGKLFNLLNEQRIDPLIAKIIPLEKVPETHCRFERNEFEGKVVVQVNE